MASLGWLVSFLVFLGVELAFRCLTSLWFAAGAAGAFFIALTGASMEQQLAGFVAVSFLTLILIRPAAFMLGRYMAQRNADGAQESDPYAAGRHFAHKRRRAGGHN